MSSQTNSHMCVQPASMNELINSLAKKTVYSTNKIASEINLMLFDIVADEMVRAISYRLKEVISDGVLRNQVSEYLRAWGYLFEGIAGAEDISKYKDIIYAGVASCIGVAKYEPIKSIDRPFIPNFAPPALIEKLLSMGWGVNDDFYIWLLEQTVKEGYTSGTVVIERIIADKGLYINDNEKRFKI